MDKHLRIVKSRRPYRLRARASAMDETRRRITRAAIELHGTIGPAATTLSAVAERAGVTRATRTATLQPRPLCLRRAARTGSPRFSTDLGRWADIAEPTLRLTDALEELYRYYRSTEQMRSNLLRDIAVLPAPIQAGIAGFPSAAADVLDAGWPAGGSHQLRRAVLGHTVRFETWHSLAYRRPDRRPGRRADGPVGHLHRLTAWYPKYQPGRYCATPGSGRRLVRLRDGWARGRRNP